MRGSRSSLHRFSILALAALGLPAFAAAQHHGGMAGGAAMGHAGGMVMHAAAAPRAGVASAPRAGIASAPRVIARPQGSGGSAVRVGNRGRTRTSVHNNSTRRNDFFNGFDEPSFNDVPGLGFDYPHLAAISGNRHHGRGFFGGAGFFDSGFLFGSPSVIIEQPVQEQQQPEAEDAIAGNAVDSDPVRRPRRYEAEASPAPVADPAPQRDVEQYVFVRRDGLLVFAVAYSWDNGTLRYITPDGRRRTMGRDALDINATEQFNEQRGVDFHAPA